MCNAWCIEYWRSRLSAAEVEGRRVIEVGSLDVNGSLRSVVEPLGPAEYIGVDIAAGPGVDLICPAEDVVRRFGVESFDLVVSTELVEHVEDWRAVVTNLKGVCRPGGKMVVTTRSPGFPYHGHPHDYWRYELEDMRVIFSDCVIQVLDRDESEPGVFLKARKPEGFVEADLSGHELLAVEPPA